MTVVETLTGPLQGGTVTAQGTPNTTVAVAAGFSIVANQAVTVTAGNLTPGAADSTRDRIDAVVVNSSGTKSVIAGPLNDGVSAAYPDTTGYALHAWIYIFNSGSTAYTGTITSDMISTVGNVAGWDTSGMLDYVQLPEPAQTFAYTFNNTALSSADPGAGVCGFNSTSSGSITHLYVSNTSFTGATLTWLQGGGEGTPLVPYYLRLWSRKNPNLWFLVQVTAFTGHTTWADLTCSWVSDSGVLLAGPSMLSTDAADTILEIIGTPPPVTSAFGRTGAVVAADGDYYGVVATAKTGATQASRYVGATTSGAPGSGTFSTGDHVIDQTGKIWICTAGGTPGTWAQVGAGWTLVKKTAVTSRTSTTTLTADPDLQFAMAATTNYIIRATIRFDAASVGPGFKFDLDGPASPTRVGVVWWVGAQNAAPAFGVPDTAFNVTQNVATTATGAGFVHFEATVENGSNTGTFSLRWAQNSSSPSAVNVRPASYLEYLVF